MSAADAPADDAETDPGGVADGASAQVSRTVGRPGAYSKGMARRLEILERASEVFRERGADGTSLRRIAEAIGVSHSALRHYFDSREQLLVAVYEHSERRRDRSGTGCAPAPRDKGVGADAVIDGMLRAAVANVEVPGLVQLYSTLVATALEVDAGPARDYFTARFERVRGELEGELRRQQADGQVRSDVDPARMAALIVAASDGLQIQWLLEPSIELYETLETFAVLLRP